MSLKTQLDELLGIAHVDREAIAKVLEEATPGERVSLIESINGRAQAKLWEVASGQRVTIDEMVPRELGVLVPVIYHGKNSLPAFSRFQKRFCRAPEETAANELWGYNYQPSSWLTPLTGPGYFVAYDSSDPLGSVAVDYRRIPTDRPASWPELHENDYRLSRFIFYQTVDYLRRISNHVLIGRATRHDKPMPNYFLLCREDG